MIKGKLMHRKWDCPEWRAKQIKIFKKTNGLRLKKLWAGPKWRARQIKIMAVANRGNHNNKRVCKKGKEHIAYTDGGKAWRERYKKQLVINNVPQGFLLTRQITNKYGICKERVRQLRNKGVFRFIKYKKTYLYLEQDVKDRY